MRELVRPQIENFEAAEVPARNCLIFEAVSVDHFRDLAELFGDAWPPLTFAAQGEPVDRRVGDR